MEKLSCIEAKKMDLVDYLFSLGHQPVKIRGNDYWYISPLRNEKTASFKINRKLNVWYDHSLQKGGNLGALRVHLFLPTDVTSVHRFHSLRTSAGDCLFKRKII